ncbi:UNVERIFIED_CONTAM: hypothetical protein GTU68_010468, partial [Idotea baltica]|nr:hypothetical protein [Idotea baltica]
MAAMHEELKRIVTMLENVSKEQVGHKIVYLGLLNQKQVVVVFSGWGKVASASTTTMLVERYKITKLVFTGVAGAIPEFLEIGDIVIGSRFVQHDMDCAAADLALAEKASYRYLSDDLKDDVENSELDNLGVTNPKVYTGLIASGDQFISSIEKQRELISAMPDLLAVEMEGAAVAQVAHEYSLPFTVI